MGQWDITGNISKWVHIEQFGNARNVKRRFLQCKEMLVFCVDMVNLSLDLVLVQVGETMTGTNLLKVRGLMIDI